MIILDSTSKSLVAKLTAAPAANQPHFTVHYADVGSSFVEKNEAGVLNGTTEVELVAAPSGTNRRVIKDITIYNADTAEITFILQLKDGTSYRTLYKRTLDVEGTFSLERVESGTGGVSDHGELNGLSDDDHTQYVHNTQARTISAVHTLNPSSAGAPFSLGANAQGQLVTGLNADQLDGKHFSDLIGFKNFIINGDCRVAQRPSALTLVKDTWGFGQVDRFPGMATGTAVSAGTLGQGSVSGISRAGTCVHFSGVTLTGTGILRLRYRVEGDDAAVLANQSISFSCNIKHDFGSGVDHTVYLRKPSSTKNDFSSVSDITNSGAVSIPSGTLTRLKYENVSVGDCSKGLEIEIKIECGAITTKNWYCSEVQLEVGSIATSFEYRPYHDELRRCWRYYYWKGTDGHVYAPFGLGQSFSQQQIVIHIQFPVHMVKTPSFSYSNISHFVAQSGSGIAAAATTLSLFDANHISNHQVLILFYNAGWTCAVAYPMTFKAYNTTSAWMAFDAEL